ncbi:MAG: hypothetical protein M3Y37_03740 [Chloroflexota bacterium]|jgi:hypothetical protein|nr:hypothetical protein [Chloroflexota bacterium]
MDTIKNLIARLTKGANSPAAGTTAEPRDFDQEREAGRTGRMSAEDQAWEAASRARDEANNHKAPQS